jgi:hypothetical protein
MAGNQNSGKRKDKLYYDALMLSLKRVDASNQTALQRITNKHVELALEGDIQAINAISNRIDGTPVATVDMSINDNRSIAEHTDAELMQLIAENSGNGTAEAEGGPPEPGSVH